MAESSKETSFFFEKDGRGSELGSGETANADPAYMSHLPHATGDLNPAARTCCLGGWLSPPSFLEPASFFSFESSDSPRRRIITFSMTRPVLLPAPLRSSELDLLEIAGSDAARLLWSGLSGRAACCCCFLLGL